MTTCRANVAVAVTTDDRIWAVGGFSGKHIDNHGNLQYNQIGTSKILFYNKDQIPYQSFYRKNLSKLD